MATLITAAVIILAGYEIGHQAILGTEQLPDLAPTFPVAMVSLLVSVYSVFTSYALGAGSILRLSWQMHGIIWSTVYPRRW